MAIVNDLPAIGPYSAGLVLTDAEFDAMTDFADGFRYELIQGVLVVTPIPSEMESSPNETLGGLLFLYKEMHPLGRSLDLTLQERYISIGPNRRRADRVIWAGLNRRPNPKLDIPTIAVEFVSEGKRNWERDYVAKRTEYLELGIAEYWIFDRFQRIMTVHRQSPAGPTELVVAESEIYRTPLLPGFELPLVRLLEAADVWRDPS